MSHPYFDETKKEISPPPLEPSASQSPLETTSFDKHQRSSISPSPSPPLEANHVTSTALTIPTTTTTHRTSASSSFSSSGQEFRGRNKSIRDEPTRRDSDRLQQSEGHLPPKTAIVANDSDLTALGQGGGFVLAPTAKNHTKFKQLMKRVTVRIWMKLMTALHSVLSSVVVIGIGLYIFSGIFSQFWIPC